MHTQSQKVSKVEKTKVRFILFLLIIQPFINIFGNLNFVSPVFEDFSVYTYLNFFALVFSCYICFLQNKIKFPKLALIISYFIFLMLVFNYFVTPLASLKWLINWLGFLFISLVLVQLIVSFTTLEFLLLQTKFLNWMRLLLVILGFSMAIVNLVNFEFLLDNLTAFAGDQIISIATHNLGIEKQSLGSLYQIIFVSVAILWPIIENKDRVLFIVILFTLIPSVFFIRTFLLSMALVFLFIYFTKNELRKLVLIFCSALFVVGVIINSAVMDFIDNYYDRLPSLKFAWYAMTENFFGLGNGGYHLYVERYESEILAMFGSEQMIKVNGFWGAPESDLVYFIASWGVLSALFFIYFIFILIKGADLFHKNWRLLPIERAMLLMMFAVIFSGISQDSVGTLYWWVNIAVGSGVVLRHLREIKHVVPIQQSQVLN